MRFCVQDYLGCTRGFDVPRLGRTRPNRDGLSVRSTILPPPKKRASPNARSGKLQIQIQLLKKTPVSQKLRELSTGALA